MRKKSKNIKLLWSLTSMVGTMAFVLSFNILMTSQETNNSTNSHLLRNMASVHGDIPSSQIAKRFVANLSNSKVTFGKKPSIFDKFRFGFLEGKYSVRLDKGKLAEIEFALSSMHGDRPKYITDKEEFFAKYQDLFDLKDYKRSVIKNTISTTDEVVETYELLNSTSVALAEVQFQTDVFGRLLRMKVNYL